MGAKHGPAIDRLKARVDLTVVPGCWTWTGHLSPKGYGLINLGGGRYQSIHRFSYEHHKGPIPEGMQVDHVCRNRACCNPGHLEVVTPQVNSLRGIGIASLNAMKTHCPQGHEYTPENIYSKPGSSIRDCRTCRRARDRRRYLESRGAA